MTGHTIEINPASSGILLKRLNQLEGRVRQLEAKNGTGELLSTAEVCALLGIHQNTWIRWLKTYTRVPARLGTSGSYRYRKSSVIRFAERIGKLSKSYQHENKRSSVSP